MRIAFFDSKPYDIESFGAHEGTGELTFKFFETKLTADTVELANGFDGVCAFVNDTIDSAVIDRLCDMGIHILAMRCAGYNNVDIRYAEGKLCVVRENMAR